MDPDTAVPSDEHPPEAVRECIARARRAGLANWLWPDLTPEAWRVAMADIADATTRVLAGEAGCALAYDNAAALGVGGYTSGMGPLLGYWIEHGRLSASPAVEAVLRNHLAHNRDRMDKLAGTGRQVVENLSKAGVATTIFKGMHTAFVYFPEPGVRPSADIDIFISQNEMPAADRVLSGLGYRPTVRIRTPLMCDWTLPSQRAEPRALTYTHRDDPWALDVQASLNRRLLTGGQVQLDRLIDLSGGEAWIVSPAGRVLGQPLLTLLLAAHASQMVRNITLLRLTELVHVIRTDAANGKLVWEAFLAGARTCGGERFFYPALALCERLQPGTIPAQVLEACQTAAPENLRNVVASLTPATAQGLDRHSFRERFMWAGSWRECFGQVVGELGLEREGRPLGARLHSLGTKLLATRRFAR